MIENSAFIQLMLTLASKILSDYGRVLGQLQPGSYGLPEIELPHSKHSIREATKTAMRALGDERPELREALIHGYVYLAQFVSSEDYTLLRSAPAPEDPGFDPRQSLAAMRVVNRIKLDMERALGEIRELAA